MSRRRWRWPWRRAEAGTPLSLRMRLMTGAACLALLFMLALLAALQEAFSRTLEGMIEKRLAADAATLISAAGLDDGRLVMPDRLPDEEFNLPDARVLGYIYDRHGELVWRSRSAEDESIEYRPLFQGGITEFLRIHDAEGLEFFVYDVELRLASRDDFAYSFVAMQPTSDYQGLLREFLRQLYRWLGGGLLVLLVLLWMGLTWGFRSLRRLGAELDEVEAGQRERLSERHPQELLRLTGSLNRLLDGERRQRERYRNSLGDLAHSLKTPLSVLQGVCEVAASQPRQRGQAQVMQAQIERMSQQIDYQLQRASLGKSGLVRHRVELRPLLESLCSTLDKVYRDKPVRVELRLPRECLVPMERGALMELLGNLLENAYRLCQQRIRVCVMVADELLLDIEDDGPGIPPEQRVHILRRGERLDTQHPGQGIGLAVVQDILDSYGGELGLGDSEFGGAAFRIRIRMD
ncbi:sensor histidine kinase [Azotobacter armeniacus]